MTVEEALSVLGLSPEADEEAARAAYRSLSQIHHPDKRSGDSDRQVEINEAYAVLSSAFAEQKSLVLVRATKSLEIFQDMLTSERAAREAASLVAFIQRRRVSPLLTMKHTVWFMGGLAAFIAWIPEKVLPLLSIPEIDQIKHMLPLLAVGLGAAGIVMQFFVTVIQNRIETLSDILSDRRSCAEELAMMLKYEDVVTVDERVLRSSEHFEFDRRKGPPLLFLSFLGSITRVERDRLVQMKAVEHGLLALIPSETIAPDSISMYRVNFLPSSFRPIPNSDSERKPLTAKEAKSMITALGASTVFFAGLTTYLITALHTWWALVPGFFTVGLLGGIADTIERQRK